MDEYKPKINLRRMVLMVILAIVIMAIAGWLLSRENFYQMLEAIRSANYLLIASAVATYFVSVAIWAGRWQTALSFINCKVKFGTRYLILCATVFLNNDWTAYSTNRDQVLRGRSPMLMWNEL